MRGIELELPVPPNELHPNRRTRNVQKFRRLKNDYNQTATTLIRSQLIEFERIVGEIEPLEECLIFITIPVGAVNDEDNLAAWMKYPIDCLQKAGVVKNDKGVKIWGFKQVVVASQHQRRDMRFSIVPYHKKLVSDLLSKVRCEVARSRNFTPEERKMVDWLLRR